MAYRIVLAEDESSLLKLLARLTQRCYPTAHVEAFPNGALALDALNQGTADLLVTNDQMPYMDGLTLIRTIRARGVHLPILSISGDASREMPLLTAGATMFLATPFTPAAFYTLLTALLPIQ